MTLNLRGIIPACVTTFDADGKFDEAQYRRYLQWLLPQGPVALAINADTGEGPHLTHREKVRVIEIVADELNGQIPIVAGLGGPFTRQESRVCSSMRLALLWASGATAARTAYWPPVASAATRAPSGP